MAIAAEIKTQVEETLLSWAHLTQRKMHLIIYPDMSESAILLTPGHD